MAHGIPTSHIPQMDWGAADRVAEFESFKARMQMYLAVTKVQDELQWNHIVLMMGEEGLHRWKALSVSEESRKTPKNVWDAFEGSLEKTKTAWNALDEYLGDVRQGPNETTAELDVRIQTIVRKCKFPDSDQDKRKMELLFHATRHFEVKKYAKERNMTAVKYKDLLEEAKLHERLIDEYQTHKTNKGEPVYTETGSSQPVIKEEPKDEKVDSLRFRGRSRGRRDQGKGNRERSVKCHRCGGTHRPKQCPAYGTECYACGGKNHWEKFCNNITTESEPDRTPSRDRVRFRGGQGRGKPPRRDQRHHRGYKQYTVSTAYNVEPDFTGGSASWASDPSEAELSDGLQRFIFQ